MKIFKHQLWHVISLVVLLAGVYFLTIKDVSILYGSFWGIKTSNWFVLAIMCPILHQVYVLIIWRLELYYNSISKAFGAKGFQLYKAGFAFLFMSRLLSIILLAIANAYTLSLNPILSYLIAGLLLIPAVYLFYSVRKYFGVDRAFGIDHFQPNIFKNTPFVKKGILKYSSNSMYIFGFFILYIPAFLAFSKAALVAALFNHIYIWVHYYFTELADIKVIYK